MFLILPDPSWASGLKIGPWEEEIDNMVYEGNYDSGQRVGLWRVYQSEVLQKEILHSVDGVEEAEVDITYYFEGKQTVVESVANDQIRDIRVLNSDLYANYHLKIKPLRQIGSDLFTTLCMSSGCHSGYPFVKDEVDLNKYDSAILLTNYLMAENHGQWKEDIQARLDKNDIEAIWRYISGPSKKSMPGESHDAN